MHNEIISGRRIVEGRMISLGMLLMLLFWSHPGDVREGSEVRSEVPSPVELRFASCS